MRQAGRYMAEYRAVRDRLGFLGLCKTPDAAAEVTVTAAERLGVDAGIIFADILLILEPMGATLEYATGDGPVIHDPVRTGADVDRLREPDVEALGYVYEAIRLTRRALAVPLIGFAGAPFTLATYLIEGGASSTYRRTKTLMHGDPGAWDALMERLVRALAAYVNAQVAAGAQAIQLFDSWIGALAPADYRRFVLPHMRRLVASIDDAVPVITFGTDTGGLLECLRAAGGDVVGLDWRIDLDAAWARLDHAVAVQGNLDPTTLFAPIPTIREAAARILGQAGARPGHVFNLGHGILPQTSPDAVSRLVETVHAHRVEE
jgi:uroporphyrinogen decarboxylase